MEGVTTAIVAFILACVIFPKVVKNKPQYYGALVAVLLIIMFGALGRIVGNDRFWTFIHVMTALLQAGALVLLILSAGGLSMKDLAGDLAETVEVVRRGGEKEIIIPRRGETPKPRPLRSDYDDDEDRPARINLDADLRGSHPPPPVAPPPNPSAPPRSPGGDDRGIPLA
jgi:hypothetical protein